MTSTYCYRNSYGIIVYVGITDGSLIKRHQQHFYGKKTKFDIALKNNPDWVIELIAEFQERKDAEDYEIFLIAKYNLIVNGYNKHPGGSWKENRVPVFEVFDQKWYESMKAAERETGCNIRRISDMCIGNKNKWRKKSKILYGFNNKPHKFSLNFIPNTIVGQFGKI